MTPEELYFNDIKRAWELACLCGDDVGTTLKDNELGFLITEIERLQSENERLQKQWDETREARLLEHWNTDEWNGDDNFSALDK